MNVGADMYVRERCPVRTAHFSWFYSPFWSVRDDGGKEREAGVRNLEEEEEMIQRLVLIWGKIVSSVSSAE